MFEISFDEFSGETFIWHHSFKCESLFSAVTLLSHFAGSSATRNMVVMKDGNPYPQLLDSFKESLA